LSFIPENSQAKTNEQNDKLNATLTHIPESNKAVSELLVLNRIE